MQGKQRREDPIDTNKNGLLEKAIRKLVIVVTDKSDRKSQLMAFEMCGNASSCYRRALKLLAMQKQLIIMQILIFKDSPICPTS